MRRIDYITLHTAGAASKGKALHQAGGIIDNYHRGKGWKCIGYHAYVEQDGALSGFARPEEDEPAAVEHWNDYLLALCVSGHGDLEPWSAAQVEAVVRKCTEWCERYKLTAARVIGHSEADDYGAPQVYKSCPGSKVDMGAIRLKVAAKLEANSLRIVQDPLAELLSLRDRVSIIETRLGLTP